MPIKVVDLFAGAGGFSEGFLANGCDLIAHIEMDKRACDTLITRGIYYSLKKLGKLHDYYKYLNGDVSREYLINKYHLEKDQDAVIDAEIGENNYRQLIDTIRAKLNGEPLDLIIGGPPCQAYSMVGRARDANGMKNDKRNYLYKYYVEFLKGLKPKVFIFENVPGLLTAGGGKYLEDMRQLMQNAGYETDYRLINAADFGVPQTRKRIIIIGWNKESGLTEYPEFNKVSRSYVVNDFLKDLPSIKDGDTLHEKNYQTSSKLLISLGIRDPKATTVYDHITRPHIKRDLDIYNLALKEFQSGKRLQYNELPQNLKTHNNEKSFLDRYKVVNSQAAAAQTVVAHIAKDGHYYIHPDPTQLRSLSVREAARLQTFPDNYKFEGSRTSQFKQIGNAVPPMLSKIIADKLIKYI